MGSLSVPIIVDFTKEEMKPGSPSWSSTCTNIREALQTHGIFIAISDQISPKLHTSIFQAADQLFALPTQIKIQNINGKPYHGYVGQNPFVPLHESLGIDYATTHESVESFTHLMWPNNNGNPSFCATSLAFAKRVGELEKVVIRMLFEGYGVEQQVESHTESTTYLLRYLKYRAPQKGESGMALPSHTDKSFITILYQNHISGLEVKARDGEWINVVFPPSSFVVMAGDACQAWSNNMVLSPIHRVTLNENQNKDSRYTMGLFSFLTATKMVQVPHELVDEQHPLQFNPFVHDDLLRFFEAETNHGRRPQNILKDFCGV